MASRPRREVAADAAARRIRRRARLWLHALLPAVLLTAVPAAAQTLDVLTVDVTPFVSPGGSRFGPQNTMGMALEKVDTGGLFAVTEVTPAAFRAMSAAELAAFDLIAINNHPRRIEGGLGTTWHDLVGIERGARVFLCSHDAVRFHLNTTPEDEFEFPNPGPGLPPFGADDLIRQAALWVGGVPGQTGLLIFNDAPLFAWAGGIGWDNLQLDLPAEWGITDLNPFSAVLHGDGYNDILPAFEAHPVYAGLSDVRFDVNTIASFGSNATAASFHTAFGSYEPGIFLPSEVIANAGDPNPGDFPVPDFVPAKPGTDGHAVSLIREAGPAFATACDNGLDDDGDGDVDYPDDAGCLSAVDLSETPDCGDGLDNDGDGELDFPADVRCESADDPSERSDCMDGFDNDGDGFADFPADRKCVSRFTLTEQPDCMDGLDNDGDEATDWPVDIGCKNAFSLRENPACNDGLDNDDDGRLDHDGGTWFLTVPITDPDPECGGLPWHGREESAPKRCGLGTELALLLVPLAWLEGLRRRRRS